MHRHDGVILSCLRVVLVLPHIPCVVYKRLKLRYSHRIGRDEVAWQGYLMLRPVLAATVMASTPHGECAGWDLDKPQHFILWQMPEVLAVETGVPDGTQCL